MRYSAQKLYGNEWGKITISHGKRLLRNNTEMEIFGSNEKKIVWYSNLGYVSSSVAGKSQQGSRLPALMCELESRIFGLTNHKYSAI